MKGIPRRWRIPPPSRWQPDSTGVTDSGYDVAGEDQDGRSWTVRYLNPALPGCLITVTYAPVRRGWVAWGVTERTEYIICGDVTDPAGTRAWSDYLYRDVSGAYRSQAEAERAAGGYAAAAEYEAGTQTWDGQPFDPWAEEGGN